jgi:2-polyprenyl-6-methoxyphenol hydroxylase-like FAD-dependent oxidoreductase
MQPSKSERLGLVLVQKRRFYPALADAQACQTGYQGTKRRFGFLQKRRGFLSEILWRHTRLRWGWTGEHRTLLHQATRTAAARGDPPAAPDGAIRHSLTEGQRVSQGKGNRVMAVQRSSHDPDAVIVGAGVSGLALAVYLGRRGRKVCLVDRAPAPRDKVCGEGIMPLGLRCLERLGLPVEHFPGVDFDGLEYVAARNGRLSKQSLRFPRGVRGRGVRRTTLLAVLEQAALECPTVWLVHDEVRGVEWQGERISALFGGHDTYGGRVLVAADGVNSRLARWSGAETWQYGERLALRRHYRLPQGRMPTRVQVGLQGSHDVYLTPVAPDILLATTLTGRGGFRIARRDYEGFLRSGPFASLFEGAEPASELLAWYHPLFHARRYTPGGIWLVGDSGGGIDPCLGMGMSLGLDTALAAGEFIEDALNAPERREVAEQGFGRERRRLFHHYHCFGRVFGALVGSPRGAGLLMQTMGLLPRMAERILAIVADMRPWRTAIPFGMHDAR